MNSERNVGILGLGVFLPSERRTNDWWPASFATQFAERAKTNVLTPDVYLARARSPAQRIQMGYMLETLNDPFRGSQERRVASQDTCPSDMEVAAARMALEDAGVDPAEIDLVIVQSMPGDEFNPSNAPVVQEKLGIKSALALNVDSGCSGFLNAFMVTEALIRSGQVRRALIVASATVSRLLDYNDPLSVNFGDAAAAAVVGHVSMNRGFVGHASRTLAQYYKGMCVGPKSARPWYNAGEPLVLLSRDSEAGRSVVLSSAELAEQAVKEVLSAARLDAKDVTHFYSHQPMAFFNRACREAAGLGHCQSTDTFRQFGNCYSGSVVLNLWHARQAGQLKEGDVTVLFALGAGLTWASTALRW